MTTKELYGDNIPTSHWETQRKMAEVRLSLIRDRLYEIVYSGTRDYYKEHKLVRARTFWEDLLKEAKEALDG